MRLLRWFLAIVGLLGALSAGLVFALTWLSPTTLESVATQVITFEVKRRFGHAVEQHSDSLLAGVARRLYNDNQAVMEARRQALLRGLAPLVEQALTQIQDLSCECRLMIAHAIKRGEKAELNHLQQIQQQLQGFIQNQYLRVTHHLLHELRIFSGSLFIAFALLSVAALRKANASVQLLLPSVLLVMASFIVGYFYVFQQNWLHSILFNDYVGWTLLAYVGVVFTLLCDVLLNRARIITVILNTLFESLGSSLVLSPC